MKTYYIAFYLMMCIGCQSTKPVPSQGSATQLTGSYYRGDGTGYNIYLDLLADGTYKATWRGCLGVYGTAHGAWRFTGERIVFSPSEETDMMKGHLRELHVVQSRGQTVFVPDLGNDYYRKYGADAYAAFHRQQQAQQSD